MSRRDYPTADRYEDRQSDFYRRPRTERNYEELDVDIRETRYDGPARSRYDGPAPSRRGGETAVKEKDETVVSRRTERGPRQPDFLREDYGRNPNAGPLVVREKKVEEDDYVSRAPTRRRSLESNAKSARTERVEKDEFVFRERERDRGPPYPRSERDFTEKEEVSYRDQARSRGPPPNIKEEIDIRIRETETSRRPPPREEYKERDVEEIRFRRGGPPPPREVEEEEFTFKREERTRGPPMREIDKEEIIIRETRSPPPREPYRGRERDEEIDITIRERERSAPPPRQRSMSRGALVRKDREEWIVRKRREPSPSPSPSPPPRDYEKEEIIIRRRDRTPSPEPEPPREPTPEPQPPPQLEPIYRPPIIQEVITHHRHIDHGVERARSPSPEPPPSPPSPPPPPPREEELEIEIRRKGVRNGKAYDEDIIIDQRIGGRPEREDNRQISRRRSVSASTRRRSPSAGPVARRRYDDEVTDEADYYNRKVSSRGYPGEAWNGATKDWGLVDIPPGTERVAMNGAGGGREEITWDRYSGDRRGRFYNPEPGPPPAPLPPPERPREDVFRETKITERRITEETSRGKTKDRMWTELTKDLVTKEAMAEMGYEYEETDEFYYVMEYLRYEDVLKLVELTEDIRRERRERLREIQRERDEYERPKLAIGPPPMPPMPPIPPPPRSRYEESIHEREYRRYR